jgi:hypothetical protein
MPQCMGTLCPPFQYLSPPFPGRHLTNIFQRSVSVISSVAAAVSDDAFILLQPYACIYLTPPGFAHNIESDDSEAPINRVSTHSKCKPLFPPSIHPLRLNPPAESFYVDRIPTPTIDRLTSVLTHSTHVLDGLNITEDMASCRHTIEEAQVYGKLTTHQHAGLQRYLNYVESDWKKWAAALKNELDCLETEKCVTKTEKGVVVVAPDMDHPRRKAAAVRVQEALKMIGEYRGMVDDITLHGEMELVKATRKLQELQEMEGGK